MRGFKHTKLVVSLLLAVIVTVPAQFAFAACPTGAQSCSSNYRVDQTFFGSGGDLNSQSSQYKAKTTVGELGIGFGCDANNTTGYCAWAGFNTTDEPYLEFVVTGNNIDLGYLDTAQVKTANGTFSVRAWQASGYVVATAADPPTNPSGGHQLAPMTAGGASAPGTEQFGINLVKNTGFCGAGCDLGADPLQTQTFSYGTAATGYDTPNVFKYNKGDIVAQSDKSSSVTNYTISYIFNINNATPSGQYTFRHVLVATGTY